MSANIKDATDQYTVPGSGLLSRIGRTRATLHRYIREGYIPSGRRRPGVRGLFWTPAQANKLLRLIGSNAERFSE